MYKLSVILSFLFAQGSVAGLVTRQSCPAIHVFGARETTVSPGYGSAGTVVNLILNAHPGATSEAITYPACGGQSSCGGISYANSVVTGTNAVASAVNSYNSRCPTTKLVLVGYSQGGQIFDNAFCGGGDPNQGLSNTAVLLSASAVNMVKAAIFMGDPRYIYGLPYEVGTCRAKGFDPRPAGFSCPSASKIQSYCDSQDPYCCNGNDAAHHQQYGSIYGQAALQFVNAKLNA
ncbi:catalytic core domain of acetyl xylan esterase from Trichoderma Reesei [Ilyonectria robusta]|uniref:catalytic core domain of acetyl xylan esterase from Trichoderma Reesei n=1 Tax=Ilyonectria robusta TaxID=1079257 RepID=UPI001E8E5D6F|nr:catalytic core domain of acetyl xylan esterase from Trichoderma Reesei [Ilyonectria robusta]KAH8664764.1 catalytic core domain of acetyl xylan esterase from Trichoderma Reesei [Ilyonectria robusta]